MRGIQKPLSAGFFASVSRISWASAGSTSSSASSERIQSPEAFASAEFFCAAKPFHGSQKNFAWKDSAISRVRSVDPESRTTISSAHATLCSVRARLASSFRVMMTIERLKQSMLTAGPQRLEAESAMADRARLRAGALVWLEPKHPATQSLALHDCPRSRAMPAVHVHQPNLSSAYAVRSLLPVGFGGGNFLLQNSYWVCRLPCKGRLGYFVPHDAVHSKGWFMPKFVIEREIPNAGKLSTQELQGISQTSCGVLRNLGPQIQWVQSYVTDNKIYCVYIAPDEQMIRKHAEMGGFPANKISRIRHDHRSDYGGIGGALEALLSG